MFSGAALPAKQPVEIGRICYTKADGTVRVYDLTRSIVIGRGPDCDIRIKQGTVSRAHCRVVRVGDVSVSVSSGDAEGSPQPLKNEYYIENLSTTNMTEINYVATWGKTKLNANDIITIGERDFVFKFVTLEMSQEEIEQLLSGSLSGSPMIGDDSDDPGTPTPIPFQPTAESSSTCIPFVLSSPPQERSPHSAVPIGNNARDSAAVSVWTCIPSSLLDPLGGNPPETGAGALGDINLGADPPQDSGAATTAPAAASLRARSVRFASTKQGAPSSSRLSLSPQQREEKRRQRADKAVVDAKDTIDRVNGVGPPAGILGLGGWFFL